MMLLKHIKTILSDLDLIVQQGPNLSYLSFLDHFLKKT